MVLLAAAAAIRLAVVSGALSVGGGSAVASRCLAVGARRPRRFSSAVTESSATSPSRTACFQVALGRGHVALVPETRPRRPMSLRGMTASGMGCRADRRRSRRGRRALTIPVACGAPEGNARGLWEPGGHAGTRKVDRGSRQGGERLPLASSLGRPTPTRVDPGGVIGVASMRPGRLTADQTPTGRRIGSPRPAGQHSGSGARTPGSLLSIGTTAPGGFS
jgi:hypothetical protein